MESIGVETYSARESLQKSLSALEKFPESATKQQLLEVGRRNMKWLDQIDKIVLPNMDAFSAFFTHVRELRESEDAKKSSGPPSRAGKVLPDMPGKSSKPMPNSGKTSQELAQERMGKMGFGKRK